jgi:phosphoglycolate phosphatase
MIASRFELVIFDCDGVLVDSEPIINQAHAHVLTACGYPITEKALVERFCGMSDPEMLEIIERE